MCIWFIPIKLIEIVFLIAMFFLDNDYTKEEMKMTQETVKIIGDEGIKLAATAVRVPVQGGHSESVNVQSLNVPLT